MREGERRERQVAVAARRAPLLPALAVSACFVAAYNSDRAELRLLRATGKVAVVDPITQYTERSRKGSSSYDADFSFQDEGGRKVQAHKSFPVAVLRAFERREPVRIHYDPAEPRNFRFEAETPATELMWFGLGAAIVGLYLIAKGWLARSPQDGVVPGRAAG